MYNYMEIVATFTTIYQNFIVYFILSYEIFVVSLRLSFSFVSGFVHVQKQTKNSLFETRQDIFSIRNQRTMFENMPVILCDAIAIEKVNSYTISNQQRASSASSQNDTHHWPIKYLVIDTNQKMTHNFMKGSRF